MFTKGWRHLYQSHHILEEAMAKKTFNFTNLDDLPAIILTDVEHKAITKKLNDVRKEILKKAQKELDDPLSEAELWELYQKAYGEHHPVWIESIRSYFGK